MPKVSATEIGASTGPQHVAVRGEAGLEAGPTARSWSGMPVEGPPRWTLTHDERQLGDRGEAQHLGLERHARAGGRGHRLLAGEGRADHGADAGDLVLGLQHRAAVLPDLAAEELHDLGRGRDRVAAEELAAGEDRGGRAHVVAVDQQLAVRSSTAGVASVRGSRSGCSAAYVEPAAKACSLPFSTSALFFAEALADPREERLRLHPEPAGQQPEHHGVLGLLGPGRRLRHLGDRDGDRLLRHDTGAAAACPAPRRSRRRR